MKFDLVSFFNKDPRCGLNVLYPQAMLRAHGHSSSVLFLYRRNKIRYWTAPQLIPTDEEIELMVEKLKSADLIGISVYYISLEAAKKLTAAIKSRLKAPVIWGGRHPTLAPEECIEFADMLCIGEGEEVVLELADTLSAGKDIRNIRNLWIKRNGSVIRNVPRPLLNNLDEIPPIEFPLQDCHCVSCEGKFNPNGSHDHITFTSRGCLFSCTYCGEKDWRRSCKVKNNFRVRSPTNVIRELERIKTDPAIHFIYFQDALFPYNSEWIKEFSFLYKKRVGLPFCARLHPALIKNAEVKLLKEAGLQRLDVSIESASERVRRKIFNRQVSDSQIVAAHNSVLSAGVAKYNLLLIADNPWETDEDKQEALDFLMKLNGTFKLVLFTLVFYPKHELTEKALNAGLINEYHFLWAKRQMDIPVQTFYKRSKEDTFWLVILLLFVLYYRHHFFPKKLILAINRCTLIKRHPYPVFYFLYYASVFLNVTLEDPKHGIHILSVAAGICFESIRRLLIPADKTAKTKTYSY